MNRQATDADRDILISACASILMYAECLMASGVPFDDAKRTAIKRFSFIGPVMMHKHIVIDFVENVDQTMLSVPIKRVMSEATYQATLHMTGAKDGILRRCAFHWFGLWL